MPSDRPPPLGPRSMSETTDPEVIDERRAAIQPLVQGLPNSVDVSKMDDPFDSPNEKKPPSNNERKRPTPAASKNPGLSLSEKKKVTLKLDIDGNLTAATPSPKEGKHVPDGFPAAAADLDAEGLEGDDRGNWGSKMEFIFTCIGYAVGLGNVWRFPYLCYKNGGGAFLVPYVIMLGAVGLPLFFMELSFGQFASLGPIAIWKINPLFKGLGYAVVAISWLIAVYYNVIISHVLLYLFTSIASIAGELPWVSCDNYWNTPNCIAPVYTSGAAANATANGTAAILSNVTDALADNITDSIDIIKETVGKQARNITGQEMTPAEEYYNNYILQMSTGIGDTGGVSWKLALCLLLAWLVVLVCLIRGIQSLGKVVYFTALFPYLMLTILLIRGGTLPGAGKGIEFYLKPDFARLADARVWCDAATQIFYSLSACCGGLICMSSYSKFNNNCLRDSLIVSMINCGTSIFAGFVIFAILGFMAYEKGVEVQDVAAGGPGLAFVVYPEALSRMPVPQLWAICFFFMMATLGFGSQFSLVECVLSAFSDEFNEQLRSKWRNLAFRVCVILGSFLLGLPMVTGAGIYLLNLVDYSVSGFPLLIVGLLEVATLNWIYGYKNFAEDISMMLGQKPNLYWKVCWMGLTPGIILATIIFNCIYYKPPSLDSYSYPPWADALGWLIALFPIGLIVFFFCYNFCVRGGWKLLIKVMKPLPEWGPHQEEDRWGRYAAPETPGVTTPLTPSKKVEYFAFAFYKPLVVGIPEYSRYKPGRQRHLSTRSIGTPYEITRLQKSLENRICDL